MEIIGIDTIYLYTELIVVKIRLQRAAKYLCKDFQGVRGVLGDIQAAFQKIEEQTDYIFKIYDPITETNSKRVKVRKKEDNSCLVYVYSRTEDALNVNYDFFEISDQKIIPILTSLYNQPILIRKRREIWSLDTLVFHLDSVEGVGDIFEIEVIGSENRTIEHSIKLFENFLSSQIHVSNEDLITMKEQ